MPGPQVVAEARAWRIFANFCFPVLPPADVGLLHNYGLCLLPVLEASAKDHLGGTGAAACGAVEFYECGGAIAGEI